MASGRSDLKRKSSSQYLLQCRNATVSFVGVPQRSECVDYNVSIRVFWGCWIVYLMSLTREAAVPSTSIMSAWSMMGDTRLKQQRPSVLCQVYQTAARRESRAGDSICKRVADEAPLSPQQSSSSGPSHVLLLKTDQSKQTSRDSRLHDGCPRGTSPLFVNGVCRWPGCEVFSEDFSSFLRHLHADHGHGDRSLAQWRVQQDIVRCMESQVCFLDWNLLSDASLPAVMRTRTQLILSTEHQDLLHGGCRAAGSAPVLPDVVSSTDCYKYHNIRPPYTYAHLIRWSILESPAQQCSLSQIYSWFSSKFFYFRHNTATWKNAVRHNLSLHKCFVRVEGGKGAVWTVDEREYQKRKSQKYHRYSCPSWRTGCLVSLSVCPASPRAPQTACISLPAGAHRYKAPAEPPRFHCLYMC
uniref:Forkhead box P3b n=1 Tax=Salarias fasciatus TaxID=181472 RepID=A0A672FFV3_SALFA